MGNPFILLDADAEVGPEVFSLLSWLLGRHMCVPSGFIPTDCQKSGHGEMYGGKVIGGAVLPKVCTAQTMRATTMKMTTMINETVYFSLTICAI